MTVAAVIFDLDGVLVDSEPYWREGFRAAMQVIAAETGETSPVMSDDDLRQYEGGRVPDTVRTLAGAVFSGPVPEETIRSAVAAAIDRAISLLAESPRTITPSVETAHELYARGFRLAVASSSAPQFIEAVLERLDLSTEMPVRESAFFLEHPKPHPEVYLNALHGLGVAAGDCLAIEDSWTGVQAALRAGLRTVWISGEPVDSLEEAVQGLWHGDAADSERPRPPLMFIQALDADAVQRFSEA
jgi:mannitol-1-/sugar-/sorbitol-6-/2-deoxyglucose-6-phosphatase